MLHKRGKCRRKVLSGCRQTRAVAIAVASALLMSQKYSCCCRAILKNTACRIIQRSRTWLAIRLGPRTQTRGMPQITVFVQVHRRLAVCSCAFKLSTRFKRTSGSRSFWSIDHHGMVLSDLRTPRRLSTSVTTIPVRIDAVKATGLVQSATLEGFLKRLTC